MLLSDRNPFSNQPGKEGTGWAARETLSAPTRKRAKTLALRGTFQQPIGKRTNVISSKEPFQLQSAGEGVQDIKNMRNLPGKPKMSTTIGTIYQQPTRKGATVSAVIGYATIVFN